MQLTFEYTIAGAAAIGLALYLFYALLFTERF